MTFGSGLTNITNKFRHRAYTMPELLITLLLMGILFSLAIVLSASLNQTKKIRDYNIAIAFSQQTVEIIRGAPFALIDDANAGKNSVETDLNTYSDDGDLFLPYYESGGIKYKRQVEITDVMAKEESTRPIGLKIVKVVVTWESTDGTKPAPFIVTTTVADIN